MLSLNRQERWEQRVCEKCGRDEGEVYHFHYGKKLSETGERMGADIHVTKKYHVAGEMSVAACNRCVTSYLIKIALGLLLLTAALAGFAIWAYSYPSQRPDNVLTTFEAMLKFASFLAGLSGLAFFALLIKSLFSGKDIHGEDLAISMKKGELRIQGFDTLWNSEEYLKLQ